MLVRREAFWKIGGFTEELGVAYNDIDFCMKLQKQGYMVLYDPKAVLYHYESQTRESRAGKKGGRPFLQDMGKGTEAGRQIL